MTLKKRSVASEAAPPTIFYGKALSILSVYLIIYTLTDPYSE